MNYMLAVSFNDIFKSKFLDRIADISVTDIIISFAISFVIGMFIFYVYKYSFSGVMYSRSFNVSLLCLTMLTNFIISAISANVVLSLGMVGALSIVRFRTAIKDPMDLVFLFWSIGAGIICGAGASSSAFYILAVTGSIFIGIVLLVSNFRKTFDTPYLLIVNSMDSKVEDGISNIVKTNVAHYKLKSKIISQASGIEWIYEIRGKNINPKFLDEISSVEGVTNTSMVSYNGEYTT